MLSLAVAILIIFGIVMTIRWSARRSRDISEYYSDLDDPTAEAMARANELRANRSGFV